MEKSALVYIGLTALTILLACFVDNRQDVPGYLRGGRLPGEAVGCDRRQARNRVALLQSLCFWREFLPAGLQWEMITGCTG